MNERRAHLLDLLEQAVGPVPTRRVFRGVGLYRGELCFGWLDDDALMLRLDEADEPEVLGLGFAPNDPGSAGKGRKRYYIVPVEILEDREQLARWVERSVAMVAREKR